MKAAAIDPTALFTTDPNTNPGAWGLPRPLRELEAITYEIPYYSIEKQAEYADLICRENCNILEFHEEQSKMYPILEIGLSEVMKMKTCSIGNMAYLALNCPFPEHKTRYQRQHRDIVRSARIAWTGSLWLWRLTSGLTLVMFGAAIIAILYKWTIAAK